MPGPSGVLTKEERKALTWTDFQRIVSFDQFAQKTLQAGLGDRTAMMVANYGEKESGLTGKVQQLYRVLYYCLKAGPNRQGIDDEAPGAD